MIVRGLRWARRELHVRRDPVGFARSLGVRVGRDCWLLATSISTWGSDPYLGSIGDRVTISAGVRFVTHDGAVGVFRDRHPDLDLVAPITVGSNVFLGHDAILLPGVTVGSNVIVGAGAVVNRDLPDGRVAAGLPARVVCTLDDYWSKNQGRFIRTFGMSPEEKRRIYLERFGRRDP